MQKCMKMVAFDEEEEWNQMGKELDLCNIKEMGKMLTSVNIV